MNASVVDIIERYKRLPISARREVMEKLRDVDQNWDAEFAAIDKLLPDVEMSIEEIQREIKAHRIEQSQKVSGHS